MEKEKKELERLTNTKKKMLANATELTRKQKQDLVRIEKSIYELQIFIDVKSRTNND